jgi:mono/diheme cytochrome c family protein
LTRALAIVLLLAGTAGADDVALYGRWCARCHGDRGDGKGPAAAALAFNGAAPRDFTAGRYKIHSVPSSQAPTDEDLARTIAKGIPGTSMPWFEDLLSADEIARLVAVVRGFATTPRPAGTPVDLGPEPSDPESVARGGALYRELGCATCHGDGGRGDGPSAAQLRGSDGTPIVPADLTRPWTFKGGATARDVTMRLVAGIGGTPMPSYLDAASKGQLWDVAHWIGSLARAPSRREAAVLAARAEPGAGEPPARRGAYVAKAGTCFLCHAQMEAAGGYVPGGFGAGGMRVDVAHLGTVYTRNLTPDPDTGLGGWTADDLRRALRDGRTPTGRALSPLDMPWPILADVADADVDALHAYLRTLPPVRNRVPAPSAPSPTGGLARKAAALAAGARIDAVYQPGNAGHAPAAGERVEPVENPTTAAWLALALGAAGLLAPRRARLPVALMGVATLAVFTWPPLRWMPAALVKAEPPVATLGRAFALPPVRRPPEPTPAADDDARALAARGRYVATLGTCSLCHTAGPSPTRPWAAYPEMGGGMRVNGAVFGTTWSRNLTPDRETGLGAWSDAEIERAIRSGLSRDGRTMHWQAMPWDHFSHLSPEDMDALVVWLRHLPPVRSRVPTPEPPRPGDSPGVAFGLRYDGARD